MPQQRLVAPRRWRLGTVSGGHPSAIVADVLRTLQMHRIAWKKVGPYTYKCRKAVHTPGAAPAAVPKAFPCCVPVQCSR